MTAWAKRTVLTYFGNAAAVRDYRAQLRGNRALWLWTSYLGLLILLAGLFYSNMMDSMYPRSISQLQGDLFEFYSMVIGLIAAVVCLVAPSLTASTITVERQRKSLDLIFSAPVPPRYLLVGKMLASLRYLIMLLVLALPVTAVCVVMGGATWGDVVGSYIVLLSSGIIFMAIGLAVSAQAATLMSAIANTYGWVILYVWITGTVFGMGMMSTMSGGSFAGATEAPWMIVLLPFTASISAPTFTTILGVEVPNFILGLIFAIAFSKLLTSGAGSSLSPFGSAETKSFRVHALVFIGIVTVLLVFPLASSPMFSMFGSTTATPGVSNFSAGILVALMCAGLGVAIPHVACHSIEADRRFRNDGLVSWRNVLTGTPSGGLPFLVLMVATIMGSATLANFIGGGSSASGEFWMLALWGLGFVIFWWGVARFVSGFNLNLKSARVYVFAIAVGLLLVPVPVFMVLGFATGNPGESSIWAFHMMYPWSPSTAMYGGFYGLLFALSGVFLAFAGERNYRDRTTAPPRQRPTLRSE